MWDSWYCAGKEPPAVEQCAGGTSLKATISAKGHFIRTFPWKISKTVTPATMNITSGGSGTASYLITVMKGSGADVAFIDGQICVTNNGLAATENFSIFVNLTIPPHSTVIASVPVDISEHPVLNPGRTFCYSYRTDIPRGSIIPSRIFRVIANVTITNHTGHMGTPYGPDPGETVALAAHPALVNDTIHVGDTSGKSFTFDQSGFKGYERVYTCLDEGENINTATIKETGQQSTASVAVVCNNACSTTVSETVCVQADVAITPDVQMGAVESFCMGRPVIGACPGIPAEKCTFTVSQSICVQIPLTFSANADVATGREGIACGLPGEGAFGGQQCSVTGLG